MKAAAFELTIPRSVEEAITALSSTDREAKVLAGGQSLIALMNLRLARPELIVDVNRIPELQYIKEEAGGLKVGAMTRQHALEGSVTISTRWPLLVEALSFVAHAPIRTRGTLGGSIAHADPGAELCGVALALDARLVVRGPNGTREVAAADFFVGPLTTTLGHNELLTEVIFPAVKPGSMQSFVEIARRRGDFALCGVAVQLHCDADQVIDDIRLAYISMGPTPLRAIGAERALIGQPATVDSFAHAAELAGEELNPNGDIQASEDFRRHLARVLTRRALAKALTGAQQKSNVDL